MTNHDWEEEQFKAQNGIQPQQVVAFICLLGIIGGLLRALIETLFL